MGKEVLPRHKRKKKHPYDPSLRESRKRRRSSLWDTVRGTFSSMISFFSTHEDDDDVVERETIPFPTEGERSTIATQIVKHDTPKPVPKRLTAVDVIKNMRNNRPITSNIKNDSLYKYQEMDVPFEHAFSTPFRKESVQQKENEYQTKYRQSYVENQLPLYFQEKEHQNENGKRTKRFFTQERYEDQVTERSIFNPFKKTKVLHKPKSVDSDVKWVKPPKDQPIIQYSDRQKRILESLESLGAPFENVEKIRLPTITLEPNKSFFEDDDLETFGGSLLRKRKKKPVKRMKVVNLPKTESVPHKDYVVDETELKKKSDILFEREFGNIDMNFLNNDVRIDDEHQGDEDDESESPKKEDEKEKEWVSDDEEETKEKTLLDFDIFAQPPDQAERKIEIKGDDLYITSSNSQVDPYATTRGFGQDFDTHKSTSTREEEEDDEEEHSDELHRHRQDQQQQHHHHHEEDYKMIFTDNQLQDQQHYDQEPIESQQKNGEQEHEEEDEGFGAGDMVMDFQNIDDFGKEDSQQQQSNEDFNVNIFGDSNDPEKGTEVSDTSQFSANENQEVSSISKDVQFDDSDKMDIIDEKELEVKPSGEVDFPTVGGEDKEFSVEDEDESQKDQQQKSEQELPKVQTEVDSDKNIGLLFTTTQYDTTESEDMKKSTGEEEEEKSFEESKLEIPKYDGSNITFSSPTMDGDPFGTETTTEKESTDNNGFGTSATNTGDETEFGKKTEVDGFGTSATNTENGFGFGVDFRKEDNSASNPANFQFGDFEPQTTELKPEDGSKEDGFGFNVEPPKMDFPDISITDKKEEEPPKEDGFGSLKDDETLTNDGFRSIKGDFFSLKPSNEEESKTDSKENEESKPIKNDDVIESTETKDSEPAPKEKQEEKEKEEEPEIEPPKITDELKFEFPENDEDGKEIIEEKLFTSADKDGFSWDSNPEEEESISKKIEVAPDKPEESTKPDDGLPDVFVFDKVVPTTTTEPIETIGDDDTVKLPTIIDETSVLTLGNTADELVETLVKSPPSESVIPVFGEPLGTESEFNPIGMGTGTELFGNVTMETGTEGKKAAKGEASFEFDTKIFDEQILPEATGGNANIVSGNTGSVGQSFGNPNFNFSGAPPGGPQGGFGSNANFGGNFIFGKGNNKKNPNFKPKRRKRLRR